MTISQFTLKIQSVYSETGELTTVSPYLGARYDFHLDDDWTLTPSVGSRHYFHSQYDGEWGPNAALALDYREKAQIFVNGTRGVHYSGVYTLALSDNYAKDTLNAEKMDYFSIGTKLSPDESIDVLASVFHTGVHDRIDKTATGYINSGNMRASGVETSVHWRPTDDLSFFFGGTYTNPETEPASRVYTMSSFSFPVTDIFCLRLSSARHRVSTDRAGTVSRLL